VSARETPALRFSPRESDRFGLRIFRCDVESVDAVAIARAIEHARVDVLILRIPAGQIGDIASLIGQGLAPIVADTLVYYDTDLPIAAATHEASATLRCATPDDAARLAGMAREIFADYVSHYSANPLFDPEQTLDGYAEWAARHVEADGDSGAWLVERDGAIVGFSCYSIDRASGVGTGVLNGILPRARGRGAYRAMLHAMLSEFARMQLWRFEISTQVHNIAVQRVWTSLGLRVRRAANTVHVNALRESGRSQPSSA
jgi:RimJ/RimL family protein N-acetyltransferase